MTRKALTTAAVIVASMLVSMGGGSLKAVAAVLSDPVPVASADTAALALSDPVLVASADTAALALPDPVPVASPEADALAQSEPVPVASADTAALALSEPALAVSKYGPELLVPGERIDYTIVYSNTGAAPAHDVRLVDDYPASLVFVSASGGGGLESGDVVWDIGTVAPGGEGEVRLALASPTSLVVGTLVTNTAKITSATAAEPDLSDNESAHSAVVAVPDLELSMAGPARVAPGGSATYAITVTNAGAASAKDVEVSDELPADLAFLAATAGGELIPGRKVRWRLGEMEPTSWRSLVLNVTVPLTASTGRVVNRASVSTATHEPIQANNAAEAGADVMPIDLRVSIDSAAGDIRPGQSVTHTVGVYNVSALAAQDVTVDVDFGSFGAHLADTSGAAENGFSRSLAGSVVRWARESMPGPSGYSIDVVTRVAAGAPVGTQLVYTATVDAATLDNVPGNNIATSDPIPVALPDLWLTKTGPAEVGPGGISTYTLRYGNQGEGDAPDTTVTDTLPVEISFLGSSPSASEAGPGVLVWDVGDVPPATQDVIRLWGRLSSGSRLDDTVVNHATVASPFGDGDQVDNDAQAESRIVAGPPAALELGAPTVLEVGGGSGHVTVEVRDSAANLVTDGTAVVLDTTLGQLGAAHLRTSGGRVTTTLTAGPVPGTALVTAAAGDVMERGEVQFVSGPPDDVALAMSPSAPTAGEPVALEVTVNDRFGNRVGDGYPVALEADRGVIDPPIAGTRLGIATAEWLNTAAGTGVVTATAGDVTVTVDMEFVPDEPATVELTADRSAVGVGGERASILAEVRDQYGNIVLDGTKVVFSAADGSVTPASRATLNGRAGTTYVSGAAPGIDDVSALAGTASARLAVDVRPSDIALSGWVDGPRGRARESRTYPGESLTYTLGVLNGDLGVARDMVLGAAFPRTWVTGTVLASEPVTVTTKPPADLLPPLQEGQVARYWRLPDLGPSERVTLTLPGGLATHHEWGAFQTLFFRSAITTTTPEATFDDLGHTDQAAIHAADHFVGLELDSYTSHVEPGGQLVYVLSFGNATSGVDGTVRITDTLPASTTYDHWQAGPGTRVRPASAFTSASRELVWEVDGGDAVNGSLRLWLDIAGDAPVQQVIINAAEIGATVYDFEQGNNSATDGGVWLSGVNLVASLDADETVEPGGELVSRIVVQNRAQRDTAQDVVVVATPPRGVELVRTNPPALVLGDGRVTWLREELPAGAEMILSATYEVPGSAVVGTVYTHQVEAESANAESYPGDNHRLAATRVVPGAPAEVELRSLDLELVACGADATSIVARIWDEWGNPVSDGTAVTWSTDLGALDKRTSATVGGEAGARLQASLTPGTATVRVRAGEADGLISVEMVPGPPRVLAVTASPRVVGHGGRTTITVEVLDECSSPVADGWPITLTAERGRLAGGAKEITLDTSGGRVRTRLSVGDQPGPLRVRAAYGGEWGETMVSVDSRPAGSTIFLPRADRLLVEGGGPLAPVGTLPDREGLSRGAVDDLSGQERR